MTIENPGFNPENLISEEEILETKREIVKRADNEPKYWNTKLARKMAGDVAEWQAEYTRYESQYEHRYYKPPIRVDIGHEVIKNTEIYDGGDLKYNPTGTMKDEMARSCTRYFGETEAKNFASSARISKKPETRIRPLSILTSRNAGHAFLEEFERYVRLGFPQIRLLVDSGIPEYALEAFKKYNCGIYKIDLNTNPFTGLPSAESPLTPEQILKLTDNFSLEFSGIDLTSTGANVDMNIQNPKIESRMYKSWAHTFVRYEATNLGVKWGKPHGVVLTPFGSGELYKSLLTVIKKENRFMATEARRFSLENLALVGAETDPDMGAKTPAEMLWSPVKPYSPSEETVLIYSSGSFNENSKVYQVKQKHLEQGYQIYNELEQLYGIRAGYSSANAMGLALQMAEEGTIDKSLLENCLFVNTGRGYWGEGVENTD